MACLGSRAHVAARFSHGGAFDPSAAHNRGCRQRNAASAKTPHTNTSAVMCATVARHANELARIARVVSAAYGMDFWRLDVFLSDADVPRVNELTYPSFDVDDPKDMRRLLQGYTEARRAGRFARPGSEVLAELRRAIEVH